MQADPSGLSIAVAIVSYRTADMVAEALPPLLEELSAFREGRVIVVDNASPNDDGARMVSHAEALGDPRVEVIRSPVNGGFAAGNNIVFKALKDGGTPPDAVLLLNPDAVMQPGALTALCAVMASGPRIGVAGSRLRNDDGSTWIAAFHFPSAMVEFARGIGIGAIQARWPVLVAPMEAPGPVDWVSGACMLCRWEMIEDIGFMDEDYFLYFEEIDYMRGAKNAGWDTWHVPGSEVLHVAGSSTGVVDGAPKQGPMPSYWLESWRRYFTKNHGWLYARLAAFGRLSGTGLGVLQRRLRGRPAPLPPRFFGDFARVCLLGRDPS
jgi:N-acetylglucosaminyl-diphospho-decaprenol L-rhamnosyltransferase